MKSPFRFANHGASGLPISEPVPAHGEVRRRPLRDPLAPHRHRRARLGLPPDEHGERAPGQAARSGRGSATAWGASTEDLPGFVVMTDPRGGPIGGASNWTAGYMPAAYQGTLFRGKGSPLLDLATPAGIDDAAQRRDLDLLKSLNEAPSGGAPRRDRAGRPHPRVRAGLPDADQRRRGRRPRPRAGGDPRRRTGSTTTAPATSAASA